MYVGDTTHRSSTATPYHWQQWNAFVPNGDLTRSYHTACLATKLTSWLSLNRQVRLNDDIRLIISSYRGGRPLIKGKTWCVRLGRPQTRRTPAEVTILKISHGVPGYLAIKTFRARAVQVMLLLFDTAMTERSVADRHVSVNDSIVMKYHNKSVLLRCVSLFAAWRHCNLVGPPVTRVLCDKTKELTVDVLISFERVITLVFWHQRRLVGDVPFLLQFAVKVTHTPLKHTQFSQYLLIMSQPQELAKTFSYHE